MISLNDYNHIKLLYEQLFKLNRMINDLIKKQDWDSLNFAIQDKNILINKIVKFEKPRLNDIKENETLNAERIKLYELEKENLELVKKIKESSLDEIKTVKKAKKILNAYEPSTLTPTSTINLTDEE